MKVIIAGSRSITNYNLLKEAIEESGFSISEIVSGGAKGVDSLGEKYAKENNISLKIFKADWKNLNTPNAIIKMGKYGKYNAKAGIDRNEKMGNYADALIAIWDRKSKGTKHMIEYMKKINKLTFIKIVKGDNSGKFK